MSKYEQGWRDQQDEQPSGLRRLVRGIIAALAAVAFCIEAVQKAWWRLEEWWTGKTQAFKNKMDAWATGTVVMVFTAALLAVAASGCAGPLAEKSGVAGLKQPVTVSGLIQVGQMGTECRTSSEEDEVRRIIRELMAAKGALAPSIIKIRLLAGSSLCGPAQGVADPVGTPDYGAYSTARAEAALYWKGGITEAGLARAEQVFNLLRVKPIRHRQTVARNPANK